MEGTTSRQFSRHIFSLNRCTPLMRMELLTRLIQHVHSNTGRLCRGVNDLGMSPKELPLAPSAKSQALEDARDHLPLLNNIHPQAIEYVEILESTLNTSTYPRTSRTIVNRLWNIEVGPAWTFRPCRRPMPFLGTSVPCTVLDFLKERSNTAKPC